MLPAVADTLPIIITEASKCKILPLVFSLYSLLACNAMLLTFFLCSTKKVKSIAKSGAFLLPLTQVIKCLTNMNEELIAPCGMNCDVCAGYLAMKNDLKSHCGKNLWILFS